MSYKKELEKRIAKKRQEIEVRQKEIVVAEAYIQAMEEVLRIAPKEDGEPVTDLRAGSDLAKVRIIRRNAGKPLHISEIITRMEKVFTGNQKAGLSGSLSSYAKQNKIFAKTAPNTFGLIDYSLPSLMEVLGEVIPVVPIVNAIRNG